MTARWLTVPLFAALATTAWAGGLPKGTAVRIEGTGIEAGWHEGVTTVTSAGCTMVSLKKPTQDGYTMIALIATARLQRLQDGTWTDVALPALLGKEPKTCLEEGSD
jgi:hypothetical protein